MNIAGEAVESGGGCPHVSLTGTELIGGDPLSQVSIDSQSRGTASFGMELESKYIFVPQARAIGFSPINGLGQDDPGILRLNMKRVNKIHIFPFRDSS